jgi:rhamnosyltransferase
VRVAIVVPTLNASRWWKALLEPLTENLDEAGLRAKDVLIIDSSSDDGTPELAREAGFQLHTIKRGCFDHGGTRQSAVALLPDVELLIYLTQDAILAKPHAIKDMIDVFGDELVGAAYGRQLPRADAPPIEAHARLFNYPDKSRLRDLQTARELGLKSIFFSNSFGAYRTKALLDVGGFPLNTIFGEDTIVAGKLHYKRWKTAYLAEAAVYHSHSYTFHEEFLRYFDVGVLHSREHWLLTHFGSAEGEGRRFVLSELRYLFPHHPQYLISALLRTGLKMLAYQLGRRESKIGITIKLHLTLNPGYWKRNESS